MDGDGHVTLLTEPKCDLPQSQSRIETGGDRCVGVRRRWIRFRRSRVMGIRIRNLSLSDTRSWPRPA